MSDFIFLIGEGIAQVPQSRDTLTRAKAAKPRRGSGRRRGTQRGEFLIISRSCGTRIAHAKVAKGAKPRRGSGRRRGTQRKMGDWLLGIGGGYELGKFKSVNVRM